MAYALVTRANSGARYFLADNNELAIMARNARLFGSTKEALDAKRSAMLPYRDDFGTRLRGFAIEAIAA